MSYSPCNWWSEEEKKCKKEGRCYWFNNPETCDGWHYDPKSDGLVYDRKEREWIVPEYEEEEKEEE